MWWFNRLPRHLPQPSGPFVAGCMDVMLGYTKDGLFMRLYYPTDCKRDDPVLPSRWPAWISDSGYTKGMAKVLTTFLFIVRIAVWWASARIPTIYGAKPNFPHNKLKCIVFSHGLGGCRFISSSILYDLASRGYLVIALEHRDNSACHTFYYQSKNDVRNDKRTPIEYRQIELGRTHHEKRYEQICYRVKECRQVLDFILDLNNGKIPCNILDDLPTEHPIDFKLNDFVGQLDVDTITISGHSFGGATALMALAQRLEFRQGVVLDPWMFPIKNDNLHRKIKQPLLFINTQTFHIATNVNAMAPFLNRDSVKMYTIRHTTHENQTDTVFMFGSWLNWFMRKLDPIVAWKINDFLIFEFLDDRIGDNPQIDDYRQFLEQQRSNIEVGLTKPWV